jgi:hypothetical protein
MPRIKRTTVNLPGDLLDDARRVTGKGVTETLVEGLKLIRRSRALDKARALRGTLRLKINRDVSRERTRR